MGMENQYFVDIEGQSRGPYTVSELVHRVRAGLINFWTRSMQNRAATSGNRSGCCLPSLI
jgi:hypothetical protein